MNYTKRLGIAIKIILKAAKDFWKFEKKNNAFITSIKNDIEIIQKL